MAAELTCLIKLGRLISVTRIELYVIELMKTDVNPLLSITRW